VYRIHLYRSAAGQSPVEEFLTALAERDRAKVMAALDYLAEQGPELRRPHAAHVRGKLWELRISRARNEYRLLYFFMEEQIVVVTHGFVKKTQDLPTREIDTAGRRMSDYVTRIRREELEL
jgi:phage-related protein